MSLDCHMHHSVKPCSTMIDLVKRIEDWYPSKTAFIIGDTPITYSELCRSIRCCTTFLKNYKREYFFLNIHNAYYYAVAYFATICSGNIAIVSKKPITSNPAGDICINEINESVIVNLIAKEQPTDSFVRIDPNLPATIAHSSGTTSIAKGVVLSQKALLSNMHAGMSAIQFVDSYRYLHAIPYYHLFGLVANMMAPLYAGGTICDSGVRLNIYADFLRYEINATCLPPVLVSGLWQLIEQYGFEKTTGGALKTIICAGAPPDYSIYERYRSFGVNVFTGYGLTECSPCVAVNGDFANKIGSCGRPVICNEVRIIDGEIAVRGENLMLGYWESPEDTKKVFSDGWLLTGDLGFIDDDGFLFVTGRKNNLIVFENGEKLQPELLEQRIAKIHGVIECMVTERPVQSRTLLNVLVVTDAEKEKIVPHIIRILCELKLVNRLGQIEVSKNPIEKTPIGKIKRQ